MQNHHFTNQFPCYHDLKHTLYMFVIYPTGFAVPYLLAIVVSIIRCTSLDGCDLASRLDFVKQQLRIWWRKCEEPDKTYHDDYKETNEILIFLSLFLFLFFFFFINTFERYNFFSVWFCTHKTENVAGFWLF